MTRRVVFLTPWQALKGFSLFLCAPLFTYTLIPPCFAGLGDPESSTKQDAASLTGMVRASNPMNQTKKSYKALEIASDGLNVREYSNSDGIIFGIAWKGRHHPDLTQLLGRYFPEYRDQLTRAEKPLGRKSHTRVSNSNLVVNKSGHLGGVEGSAYVPDLVPEGVDPNELSIDHP